MTEINITITWDEVFDTYDIEADGLPVFDRLSQAEAERLTVREIIDAMTKED